MTSLSVPWSESELVRNAAQDAEAFAELYRRYVQRVYAYVYARLRSEDAADVTQQVFIRAWDALPRYRERGTFAAWLFRIARNACADAARRRRDVALDAAKLFAEGPEEAALRKESVAHVAELVAALDDDTREMLALRFAGGLSSREIAAVVGKSEAATKKQLSRAIAVLRERYER